MFIDSDMQFPEYGITRLIKADKDIIGGWYFKKRKPYDPLVFEMRDDQNYYTLYKHPTDRIFQCQGVATGFMLIKRKVLEAFTDEVKKELGKPFDLGHNPNSGFEEGEDLAFCRRSMKLGFEVWCDPTIPLGHVGKVVATKDDYDEARRLEAWQRSVAYEPAAIDGWMSATELWWLHENAKNMDSIVEIGSWKGRSTHALLSGCKGTVWAVDTWLGSPDELKTTHKEATEKDLYAEFMKNVGGFTNLKALKMPSVEAAKQFEDKSIDMVFIDGGHRYVDAKADIEAWLPKAKKIICGHDYNFISVQEAVTEKFGLPDSAESIWIVHLDKEK
jgi:hypothetical protein